MIQFPPLKFWEKKIEIPPLLGLFSLNLPTPNLRPDHRNPLHTNYHSQARNYSQSSRNQQANDKLPNKTMFVLFEGTMKGHQREKYFYDDFFSGIRISILQFIFLFFLLGCNYVVTFSESTSFVWWVNGIFSDGFFWCADWRFFFVVGKLLEHTYFFRNGFFFG